MKAPTLPRVLMALLALPLLVGCNADTTTAPLPVAAATEAAAPGPSTQSVRTTPSEYPSGERVFGRVAVEPAYNADTGEIMYLLTPEKAPLPSKANSHAVSPLYIVEYPASSTVDVPLNCAGVPGNCPDHDGLVASVATGAMPSVYGYDPTAVLGHDHVADPPGAPDFNIAWEVIEVLFTNPEAANTHLTTDAQIQAAVEAGDAITIDLGFAFNCNVVPAVVYWKGTPIG